MRMFTVWMLLCAPGWAHAGAAGAGMGGASIGMPDRTGDVSENPATAAMGGVDRGEGLVHLGVALSRMAFSGRVFNKDATTLANVTVPEGLDWMMVTPRFGPGRIAAGVWELDRFNVSVDEPLDLSLSAQPGGPPLSDDHLSGVSRIRRDDATNAVGIAWLQPSEDGDQQFSAGLNYLNTASRSTLEVTGINAFDGTTEAMKRSAMRTSVGGVAFQAGYFFRPVPDGALGVTVMYAGAQHGRTWIQDDGSPLVTIEGTRPSQLFAGVGGSFTLMPQWLAAVDLRYRGETSQNGVITSEAVFAIRAGMEYTAHLDAGDWPIRAGFFTKPDTLPSTVAAPQVSSVSEMSVAPPFRQDLLGFTAGSGWSRGGLRGDVALVWMLANTHVKTKDPSGSLIDSGDTRSAFGAIGSISLVFGRRTASAPPVEE